MSRMCDRARVIYQFEANAGGPTATRRIVERELSGSVSRTALEDVLLLASELVSERIGNVGQDGTLTLDLTEDTVMRCRVKDVGPVSLPSGCRSLVLDQLADAWGVTHSQELTEIWFETTVDWFEAVDADPWPPRPNLP